MGEVQVARPRAISEAMEVMLRQLAAPEAEEQPVRAASVGPEAMMAVTPVAAEAALVEGLQRRAARVPEPEEPEVTVMGVQVAVREEQAMLEMPRRRARAAEAVAIHPQAMGALERREMSGIRITAPAEAEAGQVVALVEQQGRQDYMVAQVERGTPLQVLLARRALSSSRIRRQLRPAASSGSSGTCVS